MWCTFFQDINIIDVLAFTLSLCAFIATLRKKEYGKFFLIPKNEMQQEYWIKIIKSDLYELKFCIEPYKNMKARIDVLYPNAEKDSFLFFPEEPNPDFEIGLLTEGTIIKFHNCKTEKIKISFRDKYNNHYSQTILKNSISKRCQKNIWNLTFTGS